MNYNQQKRDEVLTMTHEEILHYEIARSGWCEFVSWGWAQVLVGRYFAWKTKRIALRFWRASERRRLYLATEWLVFRQQPLVGEGPWTEGQWRECLAFKSDTTARIFYYRDGCWQGPLGLGYDTEFLPSPAAVPATGREENKI